MTSLLEEGLRDTERCWQASVAFSGALAHCWIVDLACAADGRRGRVVCNARSPQLGDRIRRAVASISAHPSRRGARE